MSSDVPPKDSSDHRREIDDLTGFEILADFGKFRHRNDIFCRALWDENVTSQKVMDFYLGYFMPRAKARFLSLPAANIKIRDRGMLAPGFYADLAIFDPDLIQDHATFDKPHQLATGMVHVFVNGQQVLRDGEHTGATPGRVVRGPGWVGWTDQE